jgi:hypothetical protein
VRLSCFQTHARRSIRLREKAVFEGSSKMPLPAADRQMHVELCEIPTAGALEITSREASLDVYRNDEG